MIPLHWTSKKSSKVSPREWTEGWPLHLGWPVGKSQMRCCCAPCWVKPFILNRHAATDLTMFPVQSLEGLKVFRKDPIWQVSILHLNVHKDWQRPRSICTGCSNRGSQLRRELYNRSLPVFRRCCLPRNCWYCCSWAEISHSAVACCGPIPPGVPLAIPWFFCAGFILLKEAADIHRVRNDLYFKWKSVSGLSNASSSFISE